MTMIVTDQLIEQLSVSRSNLERAMAEYDSRIAQTRSRSHFSDEARAIRRELRLGVLLAELERHLAKFERDKLRRDALRSNASSHRRSEADSLH